MESDYIYSGPFLPNWYFELKKKNPSRYVSLITNHHTEEQFIEMRNGIEKYKPECVILHYNMVSKYGYSKNNAVDMYITDNYYLYEEINNMKIFKIKDNIQKNRVIQ